MRKQRLKRVPGLAQDHAATNSLNSGLRHVWLQNHCVVLSPTQNQTSPWGSLELSFYRKWGRRSGTFFEPLVLVCCGSITQHTLYLIQQHFSNPWARSSALSLLAHSVVAFELQVPHFTGQTVFFQFTFGNQIRAIPKRDGLKKKNQRILEALRHKKILSSVCLSLCFSPLRRQFFPYHPPSATRHFLNSKSGVRELWRNKQNTGAHQTPFPPLKAAMLVFWFGKLSAHHMR